ncbi:MAG: cytochrome c3 family protein [Chromatiales bacterium]|jgi:hypothetical protein
MMTVMLSGYLAFALFNKDPSLFLPGDTSDGHYQIESACDACHTDFSGVTQAACLDCHGDELQAVNDSHPPKKFTDPRNASKLALVDARYCVSCHREHRPAMTRDMGVTLAADFCIHCHADIATDRPSHADLAFDTCRLCHLYHDNTALYEDFLVKHLDEPRTWPQARVPLRNLLVSYRHSAQHPLETLTAAHQDAPGDVEYTDAEDWEGSSHANSGINCTACHAPKEQAPARKFPNGNSGWIDKPDHTACAPCHADETEGFLAGRHGMRLAQGMPAMRTGLARRPMTDSSKSLGCVACHPAHRFDTREAAVEACLGCHDDQHSRAYKGSTHYQLWQDETAGRGEPGSGVSCATCHLPRELADSNDLQHNRVQHNQNLNLRPNQKMIRSVCLHCHGLGYTLDALADRALINRNFAGDPADHIESLDMAAKRLDRRQ